jgi:hypothetical protein
VKTDDLDATIKLLNDMLQGAETVKDKLAITDRLLKCHSLKYKHSDEGKGGKFAALDTPEAT